MRWSRFSFSSSASRNDADKLAFFCFCTASASRRSAMLGDSEAWDSVWDLLWDCDCEEVEAEALSEVVVMGVREAVDGEGSDA
jgi:hypothetical protein